jgi:tetratricopeptide (TPR) repeat protein
LTGEFSRILVNTNSLQLFLESIALCGELIKVAPADMLLEWYYRFGNAMLALHKLDDAEEILHEALAVCPHKGHWITRVSGRSS